MLHVLTPREVVLAFSTSISLLEGGGEFKKNISSSFRRTGCCGFNAFYGTSKFTCSEDMTNSISGGLDFYTGNRGIIFGDFFTICAYNIFNIDVENTKVATKMPTMDIITKKS